MNQSIFGKESIDMSFQIELDEHEEAAALFIHDVLGELQRAYVCSGLKKSDIARRLDVDRAVIGRKLAGKANLTLRSIAELAWAMDCEPSFRLHECQLRCGNVKTMFTSNPARGMGQELVPTVRVKVVESASKQTGSRNSIQKASSTVRYLAAS